MRGIIGQNDTPSASSSASDNNSASVVSTNREIADGNGVLGDFHFYFKGVGGASRSQLMRGVIYSGDAAPTTLLGVTDQVSFNDLTTVSTWQTIPGSYTNFGSVPQVSAGTPYWIGLWWGTQTASGSVTIGVLQTGLVTTANPTGRPQLLNTAETYSSTGNPPNLPATNGGLGARYLLYVDIGDGTPMPGLADEKLPRRSAPDYSIFPPARQVS